MARRTRHALWLYLVTVPLALLLLVPWSPSFISARGDDAFSYLAHHYFAQGTPWGASTLHTTGTLGLLQFDHYHHDTFPILLLGRSFIALAVGVALSHVAARTMRRRLLALPLAAVSLWLLSFYPDSVWFFLLYATVLLIPDLPRQRTTAPFCVLLLAVALAFSVKGTFIPLIASLVVLIAVSEHRARRLPWHGLALLALALVIPLLTGSSLANLDRHVRFVFRSYGAYSETFSLPGPLSQVLHSWILLGSVLLVVLVVELERGRIAGALLWCVYALITFTAYKTSFVRQDVNHVSRAFCAVVPFLGCYVAVHRKRIALVTSNWLMGRSLRSRIVTVVVAWLCIRPSAVDFSNYHTDFAAQLGRLHSKLAAGLRLLSSGRESFDHDHERQAAKIRRSHPIAVTTPGPVGVFGLIQTPVVAHGLAAVPFPVVASYEEWTPTEVRWTSDFLEGGDGPMTMVLSCTPSSARNALALAERYRVVSRGPVTLLERRASPLRARHRPVLSVRTGWNRPVAVPRSAQRELLVARVRYDLTGAATLVSAAYQPPVAVVVVHHGSSPATRIRLNRLLSPGGVVLSGAPGTSWTAATRRPRHDLLSDPARSLRERAPITAVELEGGFPPEFAWQRWFDSTISLQLDAVDFVPRAH